ncbi:hypothetical protein ALNOE001_04190 [Candidatus Methanobinarius endosymbioticus]|uniref:Uncharacterized protein n=1 Tax=Candidatus Methanobinarius endosymbioticus TaxID=2006182 RepID=A0A366MF09_9EURY|nr:hypothetical protein ALNOE001_04190 [Candidatus Methanobinarius endosymbioticus]
MIDLIVLISSLAIISSIGRLLMITTMKNLVKYNEVKKHELE